MHCLYLQDKCWIRFTYGKLESCLLLPAFDTFERTLNSERGSLRLVFVLSPVNPTSTVHTSLSLLVDIFAAVATSDFLLDDIVS